MRGVCQGSILFGTGCKECYRCYKEILEIAYKMYDVDPCSYDHHGYCQTHGLHQKPCPHEQMKLILQRSDPRYFKNEDDYCFVLDGLQRLDFLDSQGLNESDKADAIRDSLDIPWRKLTTEQQDRLRQFKGWGLWCH